MPNPNELAPLTVTPGSIRFNTDSMKLEYYRGGPVGFGTTTQTGEWVNLTTDSPDIQTGGARGVTAGGYVAPARSNVVDYITISTTGNAIDFGDLSVARSGAGSCSSSTRGLFGGGFSGISPNATNTIDFVTISSTGNATTFGILSNFSEVRGGCSSSTRGIFAGGYLNGTPSNVIEYVTISATGNAIDFGDLQSPRAATGSCSSSTRGIFAGGYGSPVSPSVNFINVIDFITISSIGNAADFGDLSAARGAAAGCSNSTRGLFAGGAVSPNPLLNTIDYITIATLGNAIDFGDLVAIRGEWSGGMVSSTRAVWAGGHSGAGAQQNTIEYVTIQTIGNTIDFGDLTVGRRGPASLSNGHGGLG